MADKPSELCIQFVECPKCGCETVITVKDWFKHGYTIGLPEKKTWICRRCNAKNRVFDVGYGKLVEHATVRDIILQQRTCPFCEIQKTVIVSETITTLEGCRGYGIDGWECPLCGRENEIFPDTLTDTQEKLMEYIDKCEWNRLLEFCKKKGKCYDDYDLYELGLRSIQNLEFEKALMIGETLRKINPNDVDANDLIEDARKGLEIKKRSSYG